MILVSGTGCGFALSSRLTRRKRNLEMILRMLILLKGEIRYGNTSLYDAFTGAAGKLRGKVQRLFFTHSQGNAETERGILWRDFPEMCGGMSGGRRTHRGGEGEIVFPWTLSGISGAGDADEAA